MWSTIDPFSTNGVWYGSGTCNLEGMDANIFPFKMIFWCWVLLLSVLDARFIYPTDEERANVMKAVELYSKAQTASVNGDRIGAIELYHESIAAYPKIPGAYNNLGILMFDTRNASLAEVYRVLENGVKVAIATNDSEEHAWIMNNIGYVTREWHRTSFSGCQEAIKYFDKALEIRPEYMEPMYNKASALYAMREYQLALELYERVLDWRPDHVGAHLDMGIIAYDQGEYKKAIYHEDMAVRSATTNEELLSALNNKGHFLKENGQALLALEVHEQARALDRMNTLATVNVVTSRRTLCMWENMSELQTEMFELVEKQLEESVDVDLYPFDSTLLPVSDAFRKRLASTHARAFQQKPRFPVISAGKDQGRLRIGYLSFDFRDHPMGQLTLGLLKHHDRQYTDIYCYSYGLNDQSTWRVGAETHCDYFLDVIKLSDMEIASQIEKDRIEVLVDLMAYTKGARVDIVALKPSPIIVNYLGYPGTMGSLTTDFALVDRYVVPPERAASSMTEKVVYLPHVYQVNDYELSHPALRIESSGIWNRKKLGLPEDAIVFCNFNALDKMEPMSFTLWMNILKRVPNSVLWLLEPSDLETGKATKNRLQMEALKRGVLPDRIVFGGRMKKEDHLRRVSFADIFLDSLIYNAHSTASDTLWAGVPIVTVWGDTFPSRVAGAILSNVVNETLVPHTLEAYEDMAVQLARNNKLRVQWKKELMANSLRYPLFDTKRTTAYAERAYEAMQDAKSCDGTKFHVVISPGVSRLLSTTENTERRLREAMQEANKMKRNEQMDRANTIYRRVLATDMDTASIETLRIDAFTHLLDSLFDRGEHNEIADLCSMYKTDSINSKLHLALESKEHLFLRCSYAFAQINQRERAIDLLQKATHLFPIFFRAGYSLAALYHSQGHYNRGEQQLQQVVKSEHQHVFNRTRMKIHERPQGVKVVVIYCNEYGQSWWGGWRPSDLAKGLGGSEEAVVFISRELAKLGYWVEVYGNPTKDNKASVEDEGVMWYSWEMYDASTNVDIFIAWRYHHSIALGANAKTKYFWIHDEPAEEVKQSKLLASSQVDGILCVSSFQASQLPSTLQHKTVVTRNGLDPAYFVDGKNRATHFVYGSAPGRGLERLLRMWPRIFNDLPNATLSVFYGFTPAFRAHGSNTIPNYKRWEMEMTDMLLTLPGVSYRGLVDHETLAIEYADAGFYLYPTTFSETSCVSLMKAMANGAIPITSKFGQSALVETANGFDIGPTEAVNSSLEAETSEWMNRYIDSVVSSAKKSSQLHEFRQRMKREARENFLWSAIANEWKLLFSFRGV